MNPAGSVMPTVESATVWAGGRASAIQHRSSGRQEHGVNRVLLKSRGQCPCNQDMRAWQDSGDGCRVASLALMGPGGFGQSVC